MQRDLYSPCPKAHRESLRVARGRRSLIRTSVRSLSAHQTSPCLILSYVIPRPSSAPVSCIPTKSIRSLACSRALLRVAQIPLSLVATALLQSSPHVYTRFQKKNPRFGQIRKISLRLKWGFNCENFAQPFAFSKYFSKYLRRLFVTSMMSTVVSTSACFFIFEFFFIFYCILINSHWYLLIILISCE